MLTHIPTQPVDALETSHPIEVVVKTSGEINEIFDAISYHKGASLIRMLTCTLGEDKFRQVIFFALFSLFPFLLLPSSTYLLFFFRG